LLLRDAHCYKPVDPASRCPRRRRSSPTATGSGFCWRLTPTKERRSSSTRSTTCHNGQLYWSDTHQLGAYTDDYHKGIDTRLGSKDPATEVITEIYVPRQRLPDFMNEVARTFRSNGVPIIYGRSG